MCCGLEKRGLAHPPSWLVGLKLQAEATECPDPCLKPFILVFSRKVSHEPSYLGQATPRSSCTLPIADETKTPPDPGAENSVTKERREANS